MSLEQLTDEKLIEYYNLYKDGMESRRFQDRKIQKIDTKFAYHIFRLLGEVQQILMEEDLDLRRNREELKSIRRGDWSLEQINEAFARKEGELETAFVNSKLRDKPDEDVIKNLLLDCLEIQYENINEYIVRPDQTVIALRDIDRILEGLKTQKII